MLLTAHILKERFGSIFQDWTCSLCGLDQDSIPHLFTCSSLQPSWQIFFDKLLISLKKFAQKHKLTSNCSSLLTSLLPRSNDNVHFIHFNFTNWIKGFINSSTIAQVTRFTKSKPLAKILILKISLKLQAHFKKEIWPTRCTAQKAKEQQMGINLPAIIKSRSQRKLTKLNNTTISSPALPQSRRIQDELNNDVINEEIDEVMVLDSLEYFNTSFNSPRNTASALKVDRKGWGRSLMDAGISQWMEKGLREWWMVVKENNFIKKGVNMRIDLLRAGDDQGDH